MHDGRACASGKFEYVKTILSLENGADCILDHEQVDADTFASWGADLLKCNIFFQHLVSQD